MPDPEKKDETTVSPEEQQRIAHEKAVNDDPADEVLPPSETDDKKEAEKEDESEEKEVVEAKAEFDPEILAMAAELGMDESKARSYSTVADLERTLLALTSREEPKPKDEEPGKKQEPEKIHLQATDDLDDALVKQVNEALDKISGKYDEKTAALEQTIAELAGTMQANQAAQFVTRFDDMLTKHGEAYGHEIGEGATLELSGTHRTNRDKIVDEMGVIVASYQLRNRPIPSDDQLVQRALKEVFGGRDKDNGEVKKRQGQFLRRGSSRGGTAPSKQMRARTELREKLAALGGGGDES